MVLVAACVPLILLRVSIGSFLEDFFFMMVVWAWPCVFGHLYFLVYLLWTLFEKILELFVLAIFGP